ncbi:hypothetical protein HanRHA438_Chr03g0119051 [Helianthus annuus]|nr:hypothetical protein HanRHA438_Chr03g0119051 [Helianthus annuus]
MITHSYATDAQPKSTDLASAIVAASTPEQIATVSTSVDSFLHKHSPDQSRWFFSDKVSDTEVSDKVSGLTF